MAQYWLEVSGAGDLAQFTLMPSRSFLSVIDDSGTPAIFTTGATWDTVGTVGTVDICARMRRDVTLTTTYNGIFARSDGTPAAGYLAAIRATSNRNVRHPISSVGTNLYDSGHSTGLEYSWNLLSLSGSNIKFKTWTGLRADEPATWDYEGTDTTYATGVVGLACTADVEARSLYVTHLAVGTDGDPAPTGPVGGARRRSPLLLTPW